METAYDWITVGIFAGLIVLFMQRSTTESDSDEIHDPLWMYIAAGIGCAVSNYLGNEGQHLLAVLTIAGTLAFVFHYLKPFRWPRAD